jgi:galactokinase
MLAMPSFIELFGIEAEARGEAPGRVNLLGEHTDYNEGFVLPTAIPQTTIVDVARSPRGKFRMHSTSDGVGGDVHAYSPGEEVPAGYPRYVDGCFKALAERGIEVPPVALLIRSTVPIGSGLSSSAALEVAVLRALRALLRLSLDDVEIALTAQAAENRYVGVRCGVMDQMASSLGDDRHMVLIDTRTLARKVLPFPAMSEIVVLDSGVPRSLAASGYNERRAECEAAARALGVRALRDVERVEDTAKLGSLLGRRARHVISENRRVLEAASGVTAERFGALMNASHASLRDDFDVSIAALDALAAVLQAHDGVYGARLTGAGFGGACVALAHAGEGGRVRAEALRAFRARGFRGSVLV